LSLSKWELTRVAHKLEEHLINSKIVIICLNSLCTLVFSVMYVCVWGFLGSSADKESTFIEGDPRSIPVSGSSPGERIGYPHQYSWASLVAQMVKNLPATQKTWFQSLCWEDALEEGMATHSSILACRIPMDRGGWQATVHEVTKSQTQLSN